MTEQEKDAFDHGFLAGKYYAKEYTPIRRFYAWFGFISLIIDIVLIVGFILWANQYIALNS